MYKLWVFLGHKKREGDMNESDRKFLVEWGGEKWHEIVIEYPYEKLYQDEFYSLCKTCRCEYNEAHENRTFDNPNDLEWLINKLTEKGLIRAFIGWLCGKLVFGTMQNPVWSWFTWLTSTTSQRCQLICDFLRERET